METTKNMKNSAEKPVLVFATHNPNKAREVQQMLGDAYVIKTLTDIGCHEAIPETAETLEGNARIKAMHVVEHYGLDCFADDTGLEVEALNGRRSAHCAVCWGRCRCNAKHGQTVGGTRRYRAPWSAIPNVDLPGARRVEERVEGMQRAHRAGAERGRWIWLRPGVHSGRGEPHVCRDESRRKKRHQPPRNCRPKYGGDLVSKPMIPDAFGLESCCIFVLAKPSMHELLGI